MLVKVIIEKDNHSIGYIESLQKIEDSYKLLLDFDGFASNINVSDLMVTLDKLHESISTEFEKTIKEPVYEYMRRVRA
jgi:uncharacterized protein (TIGR04255 family)